MQDTSSERVSETTQPRMTTPARLVADVRGKLGWALGDLGNGIARIGRKVCDDVPTVYDFDGEFDAGYRVGERKGRREAAVLCPPHLTGGDGMTTTAISVSVHDAAALTSLSEFEIRNAVSKGELVAHRHDKRILIRTPDLTRWVESLPLAVTS